MRAGREATMKNKGLKLDWKTGFTDAAFDAIHKSAKTPKEGWERMRMIADKIQSIPKIHDVDSSDDMFSIGGQRLSFVKDHRSRETTVMTLEEAQVLDAISMKDLARVERPKQGWKNRN